MKTKDLLEKASVILNDSILEELRLQGHLFLEDLENSMRNGTVISDTVLEGYALDYIEKMDEGVEPSQLGDSRRHFEALTVFYAKMGFPMNIAKQKAFVLSGHHFREGTPTEFSKIHSQTGERKHFIAASWKKSEPVLDRVMSDGLDDMFEAQYNKQKSEKV